MATSQRNAFRHILQVSRERIATLDDVGLNSLMGDLLRARSYRRSGTAAGVRINVEIKAGDDGCDAWTPAPRNHDDWLGDAETCWQFKAGTAGQPAKLKGEISKPIPQETLSGNGRFVVIASASTSGRDGERKRLKVLREEAQALGLPIDRIEVIGADRLTNWCNEHPAIASLLADRPAGLRNLDAWSRMEVHAGPWQTTPAFEASLKQLRSQLDSAELLHLHILGPPGVGKTRFALELCRGAAWESSVIYFSNGSDFRLSEIIHAAAKEPAVELMVVADEIPQDELLALRDSLDGSAGRVKLITIGHSGTPDPRRIPAHAIGPLEPEHMTAIVSAWYPSMPREYVTFVTQFSDGYIRLARLAADAVDRNASVDMRQLLNLNGIRMFLDGMLGSDNRHHLYVAAVLARVGWTEDVQVEGEAIARLFGWEWNDVRASVDNFDRKFGIAPRGGRYRYISPKPLAIYLAIEAWNTYPDLLKKLPDLLPNENAVGAYDERLRTIASNPQAKQFSTEQLRLFFSLEHFSDPRSVGRWAAFAAADPALAARNILLALETEDIARRATIEGDARRTLVWTLVKLAWKSVAFHDATLTLALLAEAENETWNNNATGEFCARFLVALGGTPVRYVARMSVIDYIIATGRSTLLKLAITALSQVGSQHAHRQEIPPLGDEPHEREWAPRTGRENLACAEAAIERLARIAEAPDPTLLSEHVKAVDHLAMLLRPPETRPLVLGYFAVVRNSYPEGREAIRRTIESIIQRERLYWNELPPEQIEELERAHAAYEDSSLSARLQQYVGHSTLIPEEQPDLSALVNELLADPSSLAPHWPWLTSGKANDGWRLGFELGRQDTSGSLERVIASLAERGPDLRVLAGYVSARLDAGGPDWFDDWLATEMHREAHDFQLLFEISGRVTVTAKSATLIEAAVRTRSVEPRVVGQLTYSGSFSTLPLGVLKPLLREIADAGYEETALGILFRRLKDKEAELDEWDGFATRLATDEKLIRTGHMLNFYWENVAHKIAAKHVRELANAIFAAHADRKKSSWMVEFSGAKKIILELVRLDAAQVWQALKNHLTSKLDALLFTTGFPRNVIDQVPPRDVIDWIAEQPEERASVVAHLASKDFSTDETLASQIVGRFGGSATVGGAFFANLVSGVFGGPMSANWDALANQLMETAQRTSLPTLRHWAEGAVVSLRNMAAQDRQREDEEAIRQ